MTGLPFPAQWRPAPSVQRGAVEQSETAEDTSNQLSADPGTGQCAPEVIQDVPTSQPIVSIPFTPRRVKPIGERLGASPLGLSYLGDFFGATQGIKLKRVLVPGKMREGSRRRSRGRA